MRSTYRWKGEIASAEEWLCTFKTTSARAGELARRIRQTHPYEVPEIVVSDITGGDRDYLAWIVEETAAEEPNG